MLTADDVTDRLTAIEALRPVEPSPKKVIDHLNKHLTSINYYLTWTL
jgi:hypothetical protein